MVTAIPDDLTKYQALDGELSVKPAPAREASWSRSKCSLGTARLDRGMQRQPYQRQRVPEHWIVDTNSRLVER